MMSFNMKFTFTIIFLIIGQVLFAQEYKNSTGFRLGKTDGVTYKRFLTDNGAVEFMLGFGGYDKGMQAYANYQWHQQISTPFTEDLYIYYGVGGHGGYIKSYNHRNYYTNDTIVMTESQKQTYYAIGVDGIIGLEYRIYTIPMTVSMELKPYFEFYGLRYTQFKFWDFGFTAKYIF